MLNWLKSALKIPSPSGPPVAIRTFGPEDATITRSDLESDPDAWGFELTEKQSVRLFEVENPGVDQCVVTYRAKLRSEGLAGRAFLEMWCRFPGRGEFFSKGIHQTMKGSTGWASYETPFFLKQGQMPDLIKLNVAVEGTGRIWVRDVELLQTPLA
jgi:hypothetical protein